MYILVINNLFFSNLNQPDRHGSRYHTHFQNNPLSLVVGNKLNETPSKSGKCFPADCIYFADKGI